MAIGYSQEGYRPTTALANLTSQGIGPIDVTRGGSIQYAPLAAISIPSSQPELVAQGIASGITSLASGALSGIKAKWEAQEAGKLEEAKQQTLLGQKAEERIFELDKQRANAIAEASQYADAEQRIAAFDEAQKPVREGVLARLPSGFVKKEDEAKTETTKVPAQDFVHPIPVSPQETEVLDGEAPLPVKDREKPDTTIPVAEIPPVKDFYSSSIEELQAEPKPEYTPGRINMDQAMLEADFINKNNIRYEAQVKDLGKGYGMVEIKDKILDKAKLESEKEAPTEKAKKLDIEQKKLDIAISKEAREAKESEQQMAIRQQKIKDENKVLADHVENAATSLKELNDLISIIEKNPHSVGAISSTVSMLPYNSDARRVRSKLETIQGNVAVNALTAMRQASPTGAAVGNTSDKDMNLFKATEGTLDPDRATAEDILPVLKDIYRKRLDIYNNSSKILKENNPDYTPPSISYPKPSKKKEDTKSEKVSVISPDGRVGSIPKSQLEEAISKGYKIQ